MPAGTDPHSFEPTPQDLITLNKASVTFINGLHLDETIEEIFEAGDGAGVLAVVNKGVEALALGDEAGEEEHGAEEHGTEEHDEHDHDAKEHDEHDMMNMTMMRKSMMNMIQKNITMRVKMILILGLAHEL